MELAVAVFVLAVFACFAVLARSQDKIGEDIETSRTQSKWQFRQLEEKLTAVQSMLDRIAVQTSRTSIPPGNVKIEAVRPKVADLMRVMDLDTEQLAALEEFKEN